MATEKSVQKCLALLLCTEEEEEEEALRHYFRLLSRDSRALSAQEIGELSSKVELAEEKCHHWDDETMFLAGRLLFELDREYRRRMNDPRLWLELIASHRLT